MSQHEHVKILGEAITTLREDGWTLDQIADQVYRWPDPTPRSGFPFGLDPEWDATDEGHRAIYEVRPEDIPDEQAARIIYELRLDCDRLNSEVMAQRRTDFTVLWGDDDAEYTLHVNVTHEGLIIDLNDAEGENVNTWGRTAQEMADLFWGEGED